MDSTDYRQNVKTEILDVSKDDLRQDFEDAPELIQSGLYWHTYTAEYDTPGGEPIGSVISAYEFDASRRTWRCCATSPASPPRRICRLSAPWVRPSF